MGEYACTRTAVADPDCFRAGACGASGYNDGDYAGVPPSSTGCDATTHGTDFYWDGLGFYTSIAGGATGISDNDGELWEDLCGRG